MIRWKEFKKRQRRLLSFILTVVLFSGSMPVDSLAVFADSAGQDFTVTEISFSENGATLSWEYTYNEGAERIFELETDVVPENGVAEGDMISQNENEKIGFYSISDDGKLRVSFDEERIREITGRKSAEILIPDIETQTTTPSSSPAETEGNHLTGSYKFTGSLEVQGAKEKPFLSLPEDIFTLGAEDSVGKDVTDILKNLAVKVTQNGQEIAEGGTLSTDQITVDISFDVPVIGDSPEPPFVVNRNDYAVFKIEGFELQGGPRTIDLIHEGTKLGTLEFSSLDDGKSAQVKVIFDGEDAVFRGEFSDVTAQFSADLKYVGNEQGTEDKEYTVTILDKSFTVKVPALPKIFSGEKTGVRNGTQIDWKVKIEATQVGKPLSLSGLELSDDLTDVGDFITGDEEEGFYYKTEVDERSTAVKFDSSLISKQDLKYTLKFPEDAVAPVYVYFSTKIQDDFVTNGNRTITNTAQLFDGEEKKFEVSGSVSFENKWIEKAAGIIEYKTENVGGTDKTVAYITWYITVNHMGASLPNAKIIDVLNENLIFVESQWYEKSGENWNPIGSVNTIPPAEDTYFYPNSPLNQNVQLRIKTKVNPDKNIGHNVINIPNDARLEWGAEGQGTGSNTVNAGIGMNPVSKTAGTYNAEAHTIPWTVTVKESDVSVDLRVMDLLVYGSAFDYNNVSSIEKAIGSGSVLENIDKAKLDLIQGSLIPSFRQKYKPGSFASSDSLTHTVYAVKNSSGKAIADLVVVSESGSGINVSGGTLQNPASKAFSFETIVTDPAWYLTNVNKTVTNTAMLFSANHSVNQSAESVTINPRSTRKDMLKADAGVNPELNKNNGTINSAEGFNYKDKSVTFRLFINQNGVDATGGITTIDGQTLGDVTAEDVLPSGWEFADIEENTKFYLFKASGTPGSMTVGERIDSYDSFLSAAFSDENGLTPARATFKFKELKEPYVIFVKARPSEDVLNSYFNDNKTTTVTNTLNLKNSQDTVLSESSQQVKITSQILDKTMTKPEDGILKWTVSYRPYDVFTDAKVLDEYRLIDTIPEGIELYRDSQGNLDFSEGNFVVTEMTLTASGYSVSGPVFTDQQLRDFISYDNQSRSLVFEVPDKNKAYRFEYRTMITAGSGSNLTNKVILEGASLNAVNTSKSYTVASLDASATMTRNGWIEIQKVDQSGASLAGAVFTVFRADKLLALRTGSTDSNGKLVLRGLPAGSYILKETTPPEGYTLSDREYEVNVSKESGTVVTRIDGKSGEGSNKIRVTNYADGTSGNLSVSKTVSGNDGDAEKAFGFKLSIAGISGVRDFIRTDSDGNISYGSVVFSSGHASFSLKHDEKITIMGLPKDASYNLEEQDYSADGYETKLAADGNPLQDGRSYAGQISSETTPEIVFTNTKNTYGDLLISKTVAGNAGDLEMDFNFILKFENPSEESYLYDGLGGKSDGTIDLDSEGKAAFTLRHGESIRIKDLPKGLSYSIEEQIDAHDIYDVSIDGKDSNKATGTIQDATEKTVSFVNSKSTFGDLLVRKSVTGNLGELDRHFSFNLQMGALEVKTYEFELLNDENETVETGIMTFDDDYKAAFTLRHGESLKIKGLPNKVTYSLTEKSEEGYVTTTSGNENGLIIGLSTPEVVFTNTRETHGTLEIEKSVTGNGGDRSREFNFSLKVQELEDGEYEAEVVDTTSGILKNIKLDFKDGHAIFKLKHGERLSINLPKALAYSVTEDDYRLYGYTTQLSGDSSGTVEVNEALKVAFTNNRNISGGGGGGGNPPTEPEPPEITTEIPVTPELPESPELPAVPEPPIVQPETPQIPEFIIPPAPADGPDKFILINENGVERGI
ncbi:MAG: hypothetical protein EOM45_04615 [Clostridia bacterium]|nr:hypothetical protein [Clostridia bacterium]